MPELALIIVSWNVRDLLRQCLHAVAASLAGGDVSYDVVVVDNASTDDTPAMLRAEFPHVRLIESAHNLGFSGGNNLALRALGFGEQATRDRRPETEDSTQDASSAPYQSSSPVASSRSSASGCPSFVMLLNPDTVPQGDALLQLVHYLKAHPELAVVGPQLRYGDGRLQSSRRRFPQRATFFWESTPLEHLWPMNPWAQRYHCADLLSTIEQRVDWLVGAALLVRGDAITRAGLLDESFFVYSEELEWQLRLQKVASNGQRAAGTKQQAASAFRGIAYLPNAVVTHYEGQSSEQVLVGRHLYFQRSKLQLARMLYGRGFVLLLRAFLIACYGWEFATEGVKWLLGHRRSLRRSRMAVYKAVLRGLAVTR